MVMVGRRGSPPAAMTMEQLAKMQKLAVEKVRGHVAAETLAGVMVLVRQPGLGVSATGAVLAVGAGGRADG